MKQAAWEVLQHLMEYHAAFRSEIIHNFADICFRIHDWNKDLQVSILNKLLSLMDKWISKIEASSGAPSPLDDFTAPTVYGVREEQKKNKQRSKAAATNLVPA